ncbi:M48 family metallopeptidase [Pelomonas sp. KK5]|uniref:M48 family metallopeptidase n=1 Tax=Pelomonas sp. KK5 TaxID=1855730 RepID=UPI0009FA47E6|nr:M48 family metallopeptidase [Pelomonas sp. KK5]
MRRCWLLVPLLLALACAAAAAPDTFQISPVPPGWQESLPRDPELATQAYLARLPAASVAQSNAYFEGGYWLQLWNFLLGLLIAWVLLHGARSARLLARAQRIGRKAVARDFLYGAAYAALSWLLSLPLTIYQGFVREHQYGMATQSFGPWFGEQLVALAVGMLLTGVAVALLYAVLRRAGEAWWLWGTAVGIALLALLIVVSPVFIDPLFNTYKPVEDPAIRDSVLAMAHSDGVPADAVYEFDASRQTTRVSANVSGLFGSAQIRLNDNLLRRATLSEIRAVMGHELGHYVLNHGLKMLSQFTLLVMAAFLFCKWAMRRLLARHGAAWGLAGVADTASLPLLAAVFSVFMFAATPLFNTVVRTQELEADRFGLNLAREPHGMAEAHLKLVEYRKANPGPIEEFVFYDHPSPRSRIYEAMRWRQAMQTP